MFSKQILRLFVSSLCWVWLSVQAAEYQLEDGTVIRGEAVSFTGDGVVFRLTTTQFSERVSWAKFSQETLKLLNQDPKATEFAEPFIELPPDTTKKKEEIVIKPVTRPENPSRKTGLMEALMTPVGLLILGVLAVANLFAAFEIAAFKNRPAAVVCGLSAVLPVLGPIFFLVLPSGDQPAASESFEPVAPEAVNPMAGEVKGKGSSLSVSSQGGGAATASLAGQIFKRSDTTFNRRFFETTFGGFFRVVPGEDVKDLVMVFKTAKNEVVGKRVTRITGNEMHVMLQLGGEVPVAFGEISEVRVRHKDQRG